MNDSAEVASLRLEVDSSEVKQATNSLEELASQGQKTERSWAGSSRGMVAAFGIVAIAVTAVASAVAISLNRFYEASKATTKLRADLTAVTGSADKAEEAFQGLITISPDMRDGLLKTAEAYQLLVSRGLNPAEEALRSYQDSAAAFHTDTLSFIEAVASATTGEFEALKKFGIGIQRQNDELVVSFRGATSTIDATVQSLERYLIALGSDNFSGAAEQAGRNIGDTIKHIYEEFDRFWMILAAQSGKDNVLLHFFESGLSAAREFNAMLASGEILARIDAIGASIRPLYSVAEFTFENITNLLIGETSNWQDANQQAVDEMGSSWLDLPRDIEAAVKQALESFIDLGTRAKIAAGAFVDSWLVELEYLKERALLIASSIGSAFSNLLGGEGVNDETAASAALKRVELERENSLQAIKDTKDAKTALLDEYHQEALDKIAAEKDANRAAVEDHFERAERLRKEFEARRQSGDNLPPTNLPDQVIQGGSQSRGGGGRGGSQVRDSSLDSLINSLMTEEEQVRASYEERLEIIREFTARGSEEQLELSAKLVDRTEEELIRLASMRGGDLNAFLESLRAAEDVLQESFNERQRIILESTAITEEQRMMLMVEAETRFTQAQRTLELQRQGAMLRGTQEFFGNLASMGSAFGSKGFKVAQAAAIAQATVSMYSSAVKSYDALASIPYVGPFLGAAAAGAALASGAANIANIKSQNYSGAYAQGGLIPAGKFGLVGETGRPELVEGPAIVSSPDATANRLKQMGSNVVVHVHNLPGQTAEVRESRGSDGEQELQIIITRVEQKLASDARTGSGTFVPALASNFNLRRVS